ncbi:MAG: thiolase family protein [Deltaproteobacteria bacterium]|nr:thiolase family protein [Deltaproteobacteria bacterium]
MSLEKVYIVSGARTPIGRFGGTLRSIPVHKFTAVVLNEVIRRAGIGSESVDEVVMGHAYQNGECANGARMALLEAGWPVSITGIVVDRRCCSGLDAINIGVMKIQTGNADIVVAGGMESMSLAEMYVPGDIRWGLGGKTDEKFGFMPKGHGSLAMWGIPFYDRIQRGRVMAQPIERFGELNSMMTWAEAAARNEGISRKEVDEWAYNSHQKAVKAMESGKFAEEIVGIPVPQAKGAQILFDKDETPRPDTTLEQLAKLKPVYDGGVCTAGNSSSENDGAGAVVLMSEKKVKELGIKPMVEFISFAPAGDDPTLTYPAVPIAVNKALKKAGITQAQIDLIEIQEAFAAQTLADAKLLGLTAEECKAKVNVNGSGISLGHPIGATGAMRLVTLVHEMVRRNAHYGLETICGAGGLGVAAVFKRG